MSGTNYSTPGLRRVTRWDAPLRMRLAIFSIILVLGAILITWIKTTTWRQVAQLHQEFSSIEPNRFYTPVLILSDLRELNESLLAAHLHQTTPDREKFLGATRQIKQRLDNLKQSLVLAAESAAFEEVRAAYENYLSCAAKLMEVRRAEEGAFARIYEQLHAETRPIRAAIDKLLKAQNEAFSLLVSDSEQSLLHLQDLVKLSLILLWAIGTTLAVFGYRGMITPLTSRLNQSRVVIERQEKLASLGVLAAGVAHEIRNPLTAIKFRLFSLNKSLPATAGHEDTKVISGEIDRLDRIVKDFLHFARPSDPTRISLPVERIVGEAQDLMKADLQKRGIDLLTDVSGTTWVLADVQQIKQVLINLIQNSAESIGRDGRIHLRVRDEHLNLRGQVRPVAILEVADTGRGIAPEVEKRLFDPFFTTKEGGTGLGLAIAARIIEKHDGLLRYRTKLNSGTTFEIVLPKFQPNGTQSTAH